MTPEALATLHAAAFTDTRPWSAPEFAALLTSPHVFALGDTCAIALGRAVADEAELLTIATDPHHRRQGHARTILQAFEAEARQRGALTAFLEVDEANTAAIALYLAFGYTETGRRAAYYTSASGVATAAVIMAHNLS
jgi:ribosomal-protein-alanine N-acetyltransferase